MNTQETIWTAIEHSRNAQALADLLRIGHHDEQDAGKVSAVSMARAADVLHREVAAALDAMLDANEAVSAAI